MVTTGAPDTPGPPATPPGRRGIDLDQNEALALLAGAPFGRVIFTHNALPAIQTVSHIMHDGRIIIRAWDTTTHAVSPGRVVPSTVVGYQTDAIDPRTCLGWSVFVVGLAQPLTDPATIAHYAPLVRSWTPTTADSFLAIDPQLVTGIRYTDTTS